MRKGMMDKQVLRRTVLEAPLGTSPVWTAGVKLWEREWAPLGGQGNVGSRK